MSERTLAKVLRDYMIPYDGRPSRFAKKSYMQEYLEHLWISGTTQRLSPNLANEDEGKSPQSTSSISSSTVAALPLPLA